MAALRKKHLKHRVTVTPFVGETAQGDRYGPQVTGVPAYVEQRTRLKVDRRSSSPTSGQEIVSTTMVVLLVKDDVQPRTRITVWAGTARERTSEVIDSAFFEYKGTPSHVEVFLE